MRIKSLKIANLKNLQNFTISFDRQQLTTVLIGENGTGKSNLMEALSNIFRNLDLEEKCPFTYTLEYECWGRQIEVAATAEPGSTPYQFNVDGKYVAAARFFREKRQYLPKMVFAYYSGNNRRLESLYQTHQQRFVDALKRDEDEAFRTLFYSRTPLGVIALLTLYAFADVDRPAFLYELLNIERIESVLFVLRRPHWARQPHPPSGAGRTAPDFWSVGGLLKDFIAKLYDSALAPIRDSVSVQDDYRKSMSREDRLYLFLKDQAALQALAGYAVTPQRLFKYLEGLDVSDAMRDIQVLVRRRGSDHEVHFSDLSEGEQQLLAVLGLLKLMQEHECLFLLDEPDTHLNPIWKLQYLDLIERTLNGETKSQLLIATHDPLTIAGLTKSQVQVFACDAGTPIVRPPEENPQGLGVAGVLTKLFNLPSTLDPRTQKKLRRRDRLFAMKHRSEARELLLRRLSDELAEAGFTRTFRDPLYAMFVERVANQPEFRRPALTPKDMARQEAVANKILDQLLAMDVAARESR